MANIFSNLGPGLAKEAGDQSKWSKYINGDSRHFNNQQNKADQVLTKAAGKNASDVSENRRSSIKRNVKDYLSAQDLNYKDTANMRNGARIGRTAAAGALVTGAVLAPRVLSGGSLTVNNKGEKDIAGIPFI